MADTANRSIKCSVTQCSHHCSGENYCSLNCVTIGTFFFRQISQKAAFSSALVFLAIFPLLCYA